MKVLFVNHARGWGGAQASLVDLVGALRGRGLDVHVAARATGRLEAAAVAFGGPVHQAPAGAFGRPAALGRLARRLVAERFDVVSVDREHDLLLAASAAKVAALVGRAPRMVLRLQHVTTRVLPLLATMDAIVCVSEHVRARLLERYPSAAPRVRVVHYGVPIGGPPSPEKLDPHRRRRVFADRGFPIIGMVGDLWKNQEELVEIVPLLQRRFPTITVALVGGRKGESRFEWFERMVEARGLAGRVVLTGLIPRERIADVFFDLDLSVSTHRHEGFGLVHVESLAAGTPVVAYEAGGLVDILRGRPVGRLVAGGPVDLAAGIVALLEDDDGRRRMGAEGYEAARRDFSLTAMADRYLGLFEDVVRARPGGLAASS